MLPGILLVGHGTRSQIGIAQFLWLAERLSRRLDPLPVEPAFLELAEPTIDAAIERLIDRRIDQLITAPLLLFAAGHAKEDVPVAVRAALARRDEITIKAAQAEHFGSHPAILAAARQRLLEAIANSGQDHRELDPERTCHLLVGRGSRDETATSEMHDFARKMEKVTGLATEVAFLAMAKPLVSAQLRVLADRGYEQIIVQPHLLFHGDLVDSLKNQVRDAQAGHRSLGWIITNTLADAPGVAGQASELLETVILERCRAAGLAYEPSARR